MQLKATACCSSDYTHNNGWKMCHMGKEYVFMRWFFMQRGHTLLFMHIQTDRIDLLWEMELSLHYQELSLKNKILINITCKSSTDLVSFLPTGSMDLVGIQAENICNLNGQWWNDPKHDYSMLLPEICSSNPQTHSSLNLWFTKVFKGFQTTTSAPQKVRKWRISKMCTCGSAKVHSLRPSRYLLGVHGRGCSFL